MLHVTKLLGNQPIHRTSKNRFSQHRAQLSPTEALSMEKWLGILKFLQIQSLVPIASTATAENDAMNHYYLTFTLL